MEEKKKSTKLDLYKHKCIKKTLYLGNKLEISLDILCWMKQNY